jgi:hypothetical protein
VKSGEAIFLIMQGWAEDEMNVDFRRCCRSRYRFGVADCPVPGRQLLLGEQLVGVAMQVARVAGIALIALSIACWPGPPVVGMLTYSASVTLYLAYLG